MPAYFGPPLTYGPSRMSDDFDGFKDFAAAFEPLPEFAPGDMIALRDDESYFGTIVDVRKAGAELLYERYRSGVVWTVHPTDVRRLSLLEFMAMVAAEG